MVIEVKFEFEEGGPMGSRRRDAEASDDLLIARARDRDQSAFGMLYKRHRVAALRAARGFRGIDSDDLVNEAFIRIYACLVKGRGPNGAFRPYLYRTIRNVALDWLRRPSEIAMDEEHLTECIDDGGASPDASHHVEAALERSLTVRAFRSLPERWQTVLWYTEVEGLDPHEVAPLLGLKPNAVAALAYRAREGLRSAWLTAHVESAGLDGECRWVATHVAQSARHTLAPADRARRDHHVAQCARCAVIVEEVDDVGARLALVLLPLFLGAGAATAFASSSSSTVSAHPAELVPTAPAVPDSGLTSTPVDAVFAATSSAASVTAVPAASSLIGTIAATVAAPVLIVGGVFGGLTSAPIMADAVMPGGEAGGALSEEGDTATNDSAHSAHHESTARGIDPGTLPRDALDGWMRDAGARDVIEVVVDAEPVTRGESPPSLTTAVAREADAIQDVLGGVIDTVTGGVPPVGHSAPGGIVGVNLAFDIVGNATPGATLSAQAAGQVYATTTVAADGTFRLAITALPDGVRHLDVVQAVDRAYLQRLVPGVSGVLDGLLGGVDRLIDGLIAPVSLATTSIAGVSIATGG